MTTFQPQSDAALLEQARRRELQECILCMTAELNRMQNYIDMGQGYNDSVEKGWSDLAELWNTAREQWRKINNVQGD